MQALSFFRVKSAISEAIDFAREYSGVVLSVEKLCAFRVYLSGGYSLVLQNDQFGAFVGVFSGEDLIKLLEVRDLSSAVYDAFMIIEEEEKC